ncbi:MAG TPA: Holliday junction branch migration protein RuvA, partial [Rhodocyclaceae bacterium]|nr:Holliday junction branch migration protein RuvA [Rhodocyclaceae bacterium]
MIGKLTGTLIEKNPPLITVDVHGVGYEIDVPMSTFYNLPNIGDKVSLQTHLAVREDGHFLYGFLTEGERAAFRQLLKVSGIGARTALAVLSGLSVNELAQAVTLQEVGRLVKIPGIGKKTAERLLLELRDKLPKSGAISAAVAAAAPDASSDILNALLALGYNEKEALGAMKQLP